MVDLSNELAGKVAIVTGSARNIGRATAQELASAGCALVINSIQAQDLCDEVVAEIRAKGGQAIAVLADIRDRNSVNALIDSAIDAFGGVDIVVHNAAVRSNTAFEDLSWETFKDAIDLSIHACFHLAKAAVPSMKARGGGVIIGVGGMSSLRGSARRSHIMAGKMGMNALIRGLALDLAQYNIRANQVVVGSFDTIREGNPSSAPLLDANPVASIPLGRMGQPQDMANMIRFLVGPGAEYVTGQTMHCNGGAYLNL